MSGRPRHILTTALALVIVFLLGVTSAVAQSAYRTTLKSLDISAFPHLKAYLDLHDPGGGFIHGLIPQDVMMLENEVQVPVSTLEEQRPGVQFALAITPGASFGIRDSLGISRYEYLLQGLLAGTWINHPKGADDFSLLTQGGPQLTHSTDPTTLRSTLETYQPDSANAVPNLEVLATALQVVEDPPVHPGMEKAILFITPPQETDISLGLQSIIANATQQGIHIFVWLVASQDIFELPEIDQLRDLADQTQGSFFAFSHDEAVPDLESLLEPFRYVYQLAYDSQISNAGSQQISAQVNIGGETITSEPLSIELNLQPPAPAFIDPPAEIVRIYSDQPTPATAEVTDELLPAEQPLAIQVTFPDGYDHQLTQSSLSVDGTIIAENTAPPFDRFIWDLRPYVEDGVHTLSVEVTDQLGLVGKTDEMTVRIVVPSTTQGMLVAVSQNRLLVIGVTVFISAAILILVLILGGRIRPRPYPGQVSSQARSGFTKTLRGYRERLRQLRDPVTQPVKIASTPPAEAQRQSKKWRGRIPWLKHKEKPSQVLAYLMPMLGTDEPTIPAPLEITADDITLGSDPDLASLVITDPSIEGLHARIRLEGKSFRLTDTGSVAGSWVNYEQVPNEGKYLEHADIIHLGNIGLRFKLAEPGQPRKIVITPLERER